MVEKDPQKVLSDCAKELRRIGEMLFNEARWCGPGATSGRMYSLERDVMNVRLTIESVASDLQKPNQE